MVAFQRNGTLDLSKRNRTFGRSWGKVTKEWAVEGTQEESREEVKPWISGPEGSGELISAGKTDKGEAMRWKSRHVHNQKEGVFEKSLKSKLEKKLVRLEIM